MRLTRGSSGSARAGIPFMRPFQKGFTVRPFLCLSRNEIEQYCVKHELDPRLMTPVMMKMTICEIHSVNM